MFNSYCSKLRKVLLLSLVLSIFVSGSQIALADTGSGVLATSASGSVTGTGADVETGSGETTIVEIDPQDLANEDLANAVIKESLVQSSVKLLESRNKVEKIEKDIETLKNKRLTLENELAIIDKQKEKSELKIEVIAEEIGNFQAKIDSIKAEIAKLEDRIQKNKKILYRFIQTLHRLNKTSTVKILLARKTLAEALSEIHTLEKVEQEINKILIRETNTREKKESERQHLLIEKTALDLKLEESAREKNNILLASASRKSVLDLTRFKEAEFQKLLEDEKIKKQKLDTRIQNELSNIDSLVEKIKLQLESGGQNADFLTGTGSVNLDWPIKPKKGISAYFTDKNYIRRFGVDHGALDIPIAQSSEFRSPAYGYVYETKDAGLGYSYILIAHTNNLFTLYGHVSKILVKEGELVEKGQVLGLTGGMPRTAGAGLMTTGPHLHFEVHENGKKQNPLKYLPLYPLAKKYIPIKMLPRWLLEREKMGLGSRLLEIIQ